MTNAKKIANAANSNFPFIAFKIEKKPKNNAAVVNKFGSK
jgi:hypothetical protein